MIIFNFVFAFVKNKFLINKNIIIYIFLGILIVSTYFYLDLNYLNSDIAIFSIYKNNLNIFYLIRENLNPIFISFMTYLI